jgi:hypothetical protein
MKSIDLHRWIDNKKLQKPVLLLWSEGPQLGGLFL